MPFRIGGGVAPSAYATIIEIELIGFDGETTSGIEPVVVDGFRFDAIALNPSPAQCEQGQPCILMGNNDFFVLSRVDGYAFTLNSFWFELTGNSNPNFLGICANYEPTDPETFSPTYPVCEPDDFVFSVDAEWSTDGMEYPSGNGGQFLYNSDDFGNALTSVTAITFYASSGGVIRIDDFLDLSYDDGNGELCPDGSEPPCEDPPQPVPEPGTLGLLGLGLLGLSLRRRRQI